VKINRNKKDIQKAIDNRFRNQCFRKRDWPEGLYLYGDDENKEYSICGGDPSDPLYRVLRTNLICDVLVSDELELVEGVR
jgi:hypothetical protein